MTDTVITSQRNNCRGARTPGKRLEYTFLHPGLIAWPSLMTYNLHEAISGFC
jgi:hypothetical protein